MYSLEEIRKQNAAAPKPASKSKNGEPYENDGKPKPVLPYQAAAKFWPGIPEQIPEVEDVEGFKEVGHIKCNRFGEVNPKYAGVKELRQWIRDSVLKAKRPHIGIISSDPETVTVALFDRS